MGRVLRPGINIIIALIKDIGKNQTKPTISILIAVP